MAAAKIWLIEDEEDILALVYYNLERQGFKVSGFPNAEEMLSAANGEQKRPDLIVLDVMLPGIDGFEACRRLKKLESFGAVPILMLTARSEEADIISGLELGADDYLTKPFSPRVLVARIQALLRRAVLQDESGGNRITLGELVIDKDRHEVTISGTTIPLTASEFKILALLAAKPSWVFTRDQILSTIHDGHIVVTDRTVDVQIVSLRKKLGPQQTIETVRGVGYKLSR